MLLAIFLVLLGIMLLYYGGDLLVENSIRLARNFSVSNMVIGLTVVAFGTSCPELAATVTAALEGAPDIAVGNAFGSNVANLGLILGIAAIITPLTVTVGFLKREVAFMVGSTLLVYPLMKSGWLLTRLEGMCLFVLLVGFVYVLIRDPSARDESMVTGELPKRARPIWLATLGVAVAVGVLVGGAHLLIKGAITIAEAVGVSERVIGFTMVALGTSLPELATSIVATRRGEGDIVMGNLVGSNVFNLLCILGLTALVKPIPVTPEILRLDYLMMLGISVLLLIFLASHKRLVRIEGALLLTCYLMYTIYLYS